METTVGLVKAGLLVACLSCIAVAYRVELSDVAVLELAMVPNISGGAARASLKSLRLA